MKESCCMWQVLCNTRRSGCLLQRPAGFRVWPETSRRHRLYVVGCAPVCCSVLQCVAVRCSVLQCAAVCCSADLLRKAPLLACC